MVLNRTATRTPYAIVLKLSQRYAYAECVVRTPQGPIEPAFKMSSKELPGTPLLSLQSSCRQCGDCAVCKQQ